MDIRQSNLRSQGVFNICNNFKHFIVVWNAIYFLDIIVSEGNLVVTLAPYKRSDEVVK